MKQLTAFEETLNMFYNTVDLNAKEIAEHIAENVAETKDDLTAELKTLLEFLNANI